MISPSVRKYLKAIGQKGGIKRAKKLSDTELSSQARMAVMSRWMKKRFRTDRFEKIGIPGWEIVDSGIRDLANGNFSSVNALAVAELRPKLRFLGVPVPEISGQISNARDLLYQKIEEQQGDMAHARFCALLERVDSFCHTLASIFPISKCSTHRQRRWYT